MFVGREKELAIINEALSKQSSSIMIYGKRKVGKTTLLLHALGKSQDKTIYYECIKTSMKENIDGIVNILVLNKILPVFLSFDTLIDLFTYINTLNETINIIIDEYPYLKEYTPQNTVDSIFQKIIDNHLKNIRLFISGSHISMMKDLLNEKNALYGRFNSVICLKELDYLTASNFYSNKTPYDKVGIYSIFGGSPYINKLLDSKKSLKDNIVSTILNPLNPIYHYADNLLISDLANSNNAQRIFYTIANGKKKYKEIETKLSMDNNGLLSKQLKILINMDLISKVYPINKTDDNKKVRYELADNLLRFFYTYVYNNKSALQVIGADAFYEEYIKNSLTTYISHRFEDICRTYFSLLVQNNKLKGIQNIGTYYYDDIKNKQNGEFDVVLKTKSSYDIYEVKYLKTPMSNKLIEEELQQIMYINQLDISNIGFISINGFEDKSKDIIYIDGDTLYQL